MGNVGRYVCVSLPFILTVGSIVAFLIAGLTGVTNNGLYLFQIDTTNLSIDRQTLLELAGNLTGAENVTSAIQSAVSSGSDVQDAINSASNTLSSRSDLTDFISSLAGDGSNITAAQLGIDNKYDFTLWNYCMIPANGSSNCTQAKFDWANKDLSTDWLSTLNQTFGGNVTLPSEINDTLNTFKTLMKWTEVVYIIAMVALGLELVIGLFTACSRAVSCVTWLISGIATLIAIASAAMMTAMAAVVVGVVKAAVSQYGGDASLSTNFLACIWIGVAFAMGASFFWLFSICCCKPEHRPYSKRSRGGSESEKFLPSSYAPIGGDNRASGYNYGAPQRGGARSDLAYEPYSHAR
ncbi:SUR7/PalI family-domain-containing protein [Hypoxylon rubiginosum]|uniref:SUR7/PalI family-domain-containing protein n=1 Tax=Hypoxylon rubiginosum TaxID=110542 RepID=A0ACC0D6C6_9PEZI|nr:SUR7/PalI family-domain-containing protein [Hypoxylon rubiginosum]